jgi:predicted CXXCH cytochrome family protein
MAYVHGPIAEDDCTSCHAPHQGQAEKLLSASGSRLCDQCHVSVKSRAFVHDPVAAGDCRDCHEVHAAPEKALLSVSGSRLCLSCHEDKATLMAKENLHSAVLDGCTTCHDPHSGPAELMLPKTGDQLCGDCHEAVVERAISAKVPHLAMELGCVGCHDPHGSGHGLMLVEEPKAFCFGCHPAFSDRLEKHNYLHQPVADGECWGCHDPHGTDQPLLLKGRYADQLYVAFAEDEYQLCFNCHDAQAFVLKRTSGLTDFRNGYTNLHALHVNKAPKGRSCRACHGVHGGEQQKLIVSSVPGFGKWQVPVKFRPTETGGSCAAGCHKAKTYDRAQAVEY